MKPVLLILRKPFATSFSIEYLFETIFRELKKSKINADKMVLPYYSNGLKNRASNILSLLKIKGRIAHVTGDVHYAILGAWFSKRLLTIHDVEFMNRTSGLAREVYRLFWIKLPVQFAHRVTTISETAKKDILTYVKTDPSKIKVIYDFVDDIYQPVPRNFNAHKPSILCVGTKHNKNLPRIIEAVSGIPCELFIVGKLNAELIQLLDKYGVSYCNFQNLPLQSLHQLYLKADLLAYVSLREGFGMPIIEAQRTGLPVITSTTSCMPEIAGSGAIFANPNDVYSIRFGIQTIINDADLREQIIQNGFENVSRFTKEKTTQEYVNLYQELSTIS